MWPRGIAHRGNARDLIWKLPRGNIELMRLLLLVATSYIWITFRKDCVTVLLQNCVPRGVLYYPRVCPETRSCWHFTKGYQGETSSLQADVSLVIRRGCSLCRVSQVVVAVFQDFFWPREVSLNQLWYNCSSRVQLVGLLPDPQRVHH